MIAKDFFSQADALPYADLSVILGDGGLVVVAPHPDDESLGCGGLIAAACDAKIAVQLVVISDGTGSHPGSRAYPPARLRALREAETVAAAAELGLMREAITFVGLPDRFVPIDGNEADRACHLIAAAASRCAAGAVCVSWLRDPHCDHVASAKLVRRTSLGRARTFYYPIWGWTLPADTAIGSGASGFRFDISPYLGKKAAAIAAHRSQLTDLIDDDPLAFRLTEQMLGYFRRPYEILLDADATT